MLNDPSRPGSTPPSNNVPGESRLARAWKFMVRPLVAFTILAIVIALGTLFSSLAAQQTEKERAAAAPTTPTVKATATGKANSASLTPTARPTATPDGVIKIFITGEVVRPGVYEMHDGDRIIDAVQTAGGFTEAADRDRVDQAQRVRDEMRIEIPRKLPTAAAGTAGGATASIPEANPAVAAPSVAITTPGDSRVNVNTASAADLEKLPGIGEVLAQRIVDYRLKNGSFRNSDDLRKVTGVTNSIIEKIKDLIIF